MDFHGIGKADAGDIHASRIIDDLLADEADFRRELAEIEGARIARERTAAEAIGLGFAIADKRLAEALRSAGIDRIDPIRERHKVERTAVLRLAISVYGLRTVETALSRRFGLDLFRDFGLYAVNT